MTVSHLERALGYARRVVAGAEVAGLLERLACQRFLDDLARTAQVDAAIAAADSAAGAPTTYDPAATHELRLAADAAIAAWPYTFDAEAGTRACRFIELLPHIKGEWAKPVYVDGAFQYAKIQLEDWQIFTEIQLFGWRDRLTDLRRFRRSYEEVARKNAKSTRAAARQLYLLTADGEPGAHCYSAATTGEQAREVFDVARNMALREPEFRARFGVDVGKHDITIAETASSFKPLNAEGSTLDGLNVHGAVVDELHAHKTRAVWDVIDTATGARAQPLLSAITTAGSDRAGICYELRDYTIKVLKGQIDDPNWFGVIYTLDDSDIKAKRYHDPVLWRKANPNLGISVKTEDMLAASRRARAQPSALNNFLTKRLNIWVNAGTAWMDMAAWDRCADASLDETDFGGEECVLGLDLASKTDIAAAVKLFRRDDQYFVFARHYLPERAYKLATGETEEGEDGERKRLPANSQYSGWREQGWLTVTPGDVTDFDLIEDDIRDDARAHQVLEAGYDPYQATQLASHLLEDGLPMVEMRPTVLNFSEPMKQLEALTLEGRIHHNGDPVLAWMMSNVTAQVDAKDNIYPRKERPENKIDGVVALIMALGRMLVRPEAAADVGVHALD